MVLDFWAGVFVGYIVGGIFGILLMALTLALDEGDD